MLICRSRMLAAVVVSMLVSLGCGGGGGGGGGGSSGASSGSDILPSGTRIDVASRGYFPLGAGDTWTYARANTFSAGGERTVTRRITAGPDGGGNATLVEIDGSSSDPTSYRLDAYGLSLTRPFEGALPASVESQIGGVIEYPLPFYAYGSTRTLSRPGSWSADVDGDGTNETFLFTYVQRFVGFESLRIGGTVLTDVARFDNRITLQIFGSRTRTSVSTTEVREEVWFAPRLGMVKTNRSQTTPVGDPPYTLTLSAASIGGTSWAPAAADAVALDGTAIDIPLTHRDLVYDAVRDRYYASIPASAATGANRIAVIDAVTGAVSYSAPVGTDPGALAIAADASVLYVGLDGTNALARLSLPALTVQSSVSIPPSGALAQRVVGIAVSPTNPALAAAAVSPNSGFPTGSVLLLRDMVIQARTIAPAQGATSLVFDPTAPTLFGLDNASRSTLRRYDVLADGLGHQASAPASLYVESSRSIPTRLLRAGSDVLAGGSIYDAATLRRRGQVTGTRGCAPQPSSSSVILCLATYGDAPNTLLAVETASLAARARLGLGALVPYASLDLVVGPTGRVAFSGPIGSSVSDARTSVRLFHSTSLPEPAVAAPSWPIAIYGTTDATVLEVGMPYADVVYDATRDRYYASIPGTVPGAGNTLAIIDPATGATTQSRVIGSNPGALAVGRDGSTLYVGLDGSAEIVRLALPGLTELGRARLPLDRTFGAEQRAGRIAVSPAEADTLGVTLVIAGNLSIDGEAALFRNLTLATDRLARESGNNLITFEAGGAALLALQTVSSENALRRMPVTASGLIEGASVLGASGSSGSRALAAFGTQVIAGPVLYTAGTLSRQGILATGDCWPALASGRLLCLQSFGSTRVQVFDPVSRTAVATVTDAGITASAASRLIAGRSGTVALTFGRLTTLADSPGVRIVSSAALP